MSALQACPKCGICSSNVCSRGNSRSFFSHEGNCVSFRSAGCQLPGCPGALKWEALRDALPPRCPLALAHLLDLLPPVLLRKARWRQPASPAGVEGAELGGRQAGLALPPLRTPGGIRGVLCATCSLGNGSN